LGLLLIWFLRLSSVLRLFSPSLSLFPSPPPLPLSLQIVTGRNLSRGIRFFSCFYLCRYKKEGERERGKGEGRGEERGKMRGESEEEEKRK
jgi:hypothetical protein